MWSACECCNVYNVGEHRLKMWDIVLMNWTSGIADSLCNYTFLNTCEDLGKIMGVVYCMQVRLFHFLRAALLLIDRVKVVRKWVHSYEACTALNGFYRNVLNLQVCMLPM